MVTTRSQKDRARRFQTAHSVVASALSWGARLPISALSNQGTYSSFPRAGQIISFGDSGSSCFHGQYIGRLWAALDGFWFDLNNNGDREGYEYYDIRKAWAVAPSQLRPWVEERLYSDASVHLTRLPDLPNHAPFVVMGSRHRGNAVEAPGTLQRIAPKGGWYDAEVFYEPPGYLCTRDHERRVPTDASFTVRLACMSHGLWATLI